MLTHNKPSPTKIAIPTETEVCDVISSAVAHLKVTAAALRADALDHDIASSAARMISEQEINLDGIAWKIDKMIGEDHELSVLHERLIAAHAAWERYLVDNEYADCAECAEEREYNRLEEMFLAYPCATRSAARFKATKILENDLLFDGIDNSNGQDRLKAFLRSLT